MLGWVAAVIETESPSQPRPAVIQRMCTSATAGAFCVARPYGTDSAAIAGSPFGNVVEFRTEAVEPKHLQQSVNSGLLLVQVNLKKDFSGHRHLFPTNY